MFYSVTCKNADCGKRFKIRGPLKAGVHKVGCPFCSKKMSVRIAETPAEEGEPKQAATPAAPEQISKKYESKLASLQAEHAKKQAALKEAYDKKRAALKAAFDRQRSAAQAELAKAKAAIEAEMQAAIAASRKAAEEKKRKEAAKQEPKQAACQNKPYQKTLDWTKMHASGLMHAVPNPMAQPQQKPKPQQMAKSDSGPQTLKKVEKPYLIAHHKDTGRQLRFVDDECGRPFGSPANSNAAQSTEKVFLKQGANTIGRYDPMTPSDIGIDGNYDSRMSRCSTCIEMTRTPQGFRFAFTLKNTKNPVYCNGLKMVANKPYPINYGADIIMGETRFKLMCDM